MDILTTLARQAEQVEVVSLQNEKTTVEYEANQLKTCTVNETKGTAVRVIRKGRVGCAGSSDEKAMDKLAVNVLESAAYGDPAAFSFPGPQPAPAVQTFDQAIAGLPIARMVEIGREILELVMPVEPEARCNVLVERSLLSAGIRNQAGLDVSFQTSPLSIGLEIHCVQKEDVLILFDQYGTTLWEDDYLGFARRLVEKFKQARSITSLRPGRMPVLFSPAGALALLLPLSQGLNGKEVHKGISPLKGKLGEQIFDEKISLSDDGTLPGRFASSTYDDEGVPRRRNRLIEQGVLKSFIFDLKTAARAGAESTGNAARSLFNPPEPAFTNLIIQPGETPLKEMLAGIDEGILVDNLLGLGQGNIISGAFSNPLALAFKIEKGEIVGRVKDMSIAGNIYDLLKDVAAVSQEYQWAFSSFMAPYILIPEMNVAGKSQ
ncbi:MAG TPA: metallopeptidase TldD-related protein [Anaerolineales bacterium]|nr:metallopeptidase TldD-related protein [Anaerolineales bacterium]